jgi:hypothetical protein
MGGIVLCQSDRDLDPENIAAENASSAMTPTTINAPRAPFKLARRLCCARFGKPGDDVLNELSSIV